MALQALFDTVLKLYNEDTDDDRDDLADHLAKEMVMQMQDPAIRREVYQFALERNNDISMMEVHDVMDGLVQVLRGDSLE